MSYIDRTNEFINGLGAEAYLVGGAVRDSLLPDRRPKDADYVVRLDLKDLRTALKKSGATFGPLALRTGQVIGYRAAKRGVGAIEIALPRVERKQAKSLEADWGNERHRFEIVVDPSVTLAEDAVRRDFTINALYMPVGKPAEDFIYSDIGHWLGPNRAVLDPTGMGWNDLADGFIRTTHKDSFADDPLRILRALRFVSILGFDLAPMTYDEMNAHASAVTGLTGKGVSGTALDELSKILMGRHVAKALRIADDTGVLATLLPELKDMLEFGSQQSEFHDLTVAEHTFVALDAAAGMGLNLRTRFALLFHDAGKPAAAWMGEDGFLHYYEPSDAVWDKAQRLNGLRSKPQDHAVISAMLARKALKRLNADSKLIRDVPRIIERHMVPLTMKVKPTKVRKWRVELGDDLLTDLLKHRLADCLGKSVVDYEGLRAIERMERIHAEAVRDRVPASPKDLKDAGLIDGHDLIELSIEQAKIGKILAQLLHEVISDPSRMDREWLLKRAARLGAKT